MITAEELTPLARAIREEGEGIAAHPDLILRLVDLIYLFREDAPVPS